VVPGLNLRFAAAVACLTVPALAGGAEHPHPDWLVGVGLGGTWGEYRGPTASVELDLGRRGQYFGFVLEGGAGVNKDGCVVGQANLALGWRGHFLRGPVRPTAFLGVQAGYVNEHEGSRYLFEYAVAGGRAFAGLSVFLGPRLSVGGELGVTGGYRYQVAGPSGYSGFDLSGEARVRVTF
jgi:hypothetical protein